MRCLRCSPADASFQFSLRVAIPTFLSWNAATYTIKYKNSSEMCVLVVTTGGSAPSVAGRPGEELSHLLSGRSEAAAAARSQCNRY